MASFLFADNSPSYGQSTSDFKSRQTKALKHIALYANELRYREEVAIATRQEITKTIKNADQRIKWNDQEKTIAALDVVSGGLRKLANKGGTGAVIGRSIEFMGLEWKRSIIDRDYSNTMRIVAGQQASLQRYRLMTDKIYEKRENALNYYKERGEIPPGWSPTDFRGMDLAGVRQEVALGPLTAWRSVRFTSGGRSVVGDQQCSLMTNGRNLRSFVEAFAGGQTCNPMPANSNSSGGVMDCRTSNTRSTIRMLNEQTIVVQFAVSARGAPTENVEMQFERCD